MERREPGKGCIMGLEKWKDKKSWDLAVIKDDGSRIDTKIVYCAVANTLEDKSGLAYVEGVRFSLYYV